jgi:Rps23 Pro-64 3,4-dihydroxylase Tpa1-like proline 4-hydroxylase
VVRLKHLAIDDFLPAEDHAALLAFTLENEAAFTPSEVRREGSAYHAPETRKSLFCQAPLGALEDCFRAAVLARKDEFFAATGTPPFEVAKCEIELAAHRDGCFFAPHQDTFTGESRAGYRSDRLVSSVWYFHAQPRGFTGGELAIYPFGEGEPDLIEPRNNRLVVFPSVAFHEVLPISCPGDAFADARFSINCWLRRARDQ